MIEMNRDNAITLKAKRLSSVQPTIQMAKLDKGAKQRFDRQATLAIVMGARPFSLFEDKYMRGFIQSVSGNTYTPPGRDNIGGKELDGLYNELMEEVTSKLASQNTFHFILDESNDVSSNRMINLSVHCPRLGSFFIGNTNTFAATLNATFFVSWFINLVGKFTKGDWAKVSGIATDTCAIIRKMWRVLESDLKLKHVFMVPCDSHGIQLLIKDLIDGVPFIKSTVARAQKIARSFRKATKQYNILREH